MSANQESRSGRLNLEQQKKRAKELLRAHRQGNEDASGRFVHHLPRARALSAVQAGAQKFSLTEAQLVVAREAGFPSFPAMKHAIELERLDLDGKVEALLDAALSRNAASVNAVLHSDPGIVRRSLHLAAALGDADSALALLDQNPARATERGGVRQWSPLFYTCAARFGRGDPHVNAQRLRIVTRLLELGADPNDEIESVGAPGGYRSVLQAAARDTASVELVDALLRARASLTQTGGTAGPVLPLTDAVIGRNIECVRRLLEAGPPAWERREALELAIFQDRADVCRLLLEHGAQPSAAGRWFGHQGSCLHGALLLVCGRELLEVLLASDVDITVTDRDGRTAYAVAVRTGHHVAAELLRSRGASDSEIDDVDRLIAACIAADGDRARSILEAHPALSSGFRHTDHQVLNWALRNGRFDAVPLLLECGIDPNVADDHGETALHLAVRAGHAASIAALEAAGASRSARNFDGRTPFDDLDPREDRSESSAIFEAAVRAVRNGDVEALRALLDEEPDLVHQRSRRMHRATLLHYVATNGVEPSRDPRRGTPALWRTPKTAPAIAELLLQRGAVPDAAARTYGGGPDETALGLTVTSNFPEEAGVMGDIVRVLVRGGAHVDGHDGRGAPLIGAIGHRRTSGVDALLEAGARIPDLYCAAGVGRLDLVVQFARGASQRTLDGALRAAASFDRADAVDALLDLGADITAKIGHGLTALHWAAWYGSRDSVDRLLQRGASLESKNEHGGTVLGTAIHAAVHGDMGVDHAPIIERLCAAGANIDWLGDALTGVAAIDQILRRYRSR
jgi:ankyrin repeat protein